MSIKYTHIIDAVEDEGVQIPSYYGKYLAASYDEALIKAKEADFMAGIRVEGIEKGDLFNNKEEFEDLIKNVEYPVAIVPIV